MKTTLTTIAVVTSLALSNVSLAENFTLTNINKVRDVVSQTMKAYGGLEKVSGLNQVFVDYDVTNTNAGQSLKPEPPWDKTRGDRKDAFDFENQATMTEFAGAGGGNRFAGRTVVNGDDSLNIDPYRKTVAKLEQANFEQSAGPGIRVNSTLLLRQLNQYIGSASYMGEQLLDKNVHDVVRFTMPGGPAISLYIDQKTKLINKSERVVGPFLVEYYFTNHKKVDDVLFAHESSYTVNGDPSQTFTVEKYELNQPVSQWLTAPKDYTKVAATSASTNETNKLADGVYWVKQNNQNSLFIEYDDHLVMVGGLAGAANRIAEIKKTVADKPVKYAVMTHHHADHIGGAQDIVANGTKIVTVKQHKQVIYDSLDDEHKAKAKFTLVDDKKVMKGKLNDLMLVDIGPTPHAEHYLMAYLPKHGIMFDADHFGIPDSGPMPAKTPNVEHLIKSIKKHQLNVKSIASAHSNRLAKYSDLIQSYETSSTVGQ